MVFPVRTSQKGQLARGKTRPESDLGFATRTRSYSRLLDGSVVSEVDPIELTILLTIDVWVTVEN